jgi:hypothetical protein
LSAPEFHARFRHEKNMFSHCGRFDLHRNFYRLLKAIRPVVRVAAGRGTRDSAGESTAGDADAAGEHANKPSARNATNQRVAAGSASAANAANAAGSAAATVVPKHAAHRATRHEHAAAITVVGKFMQASWAWIFRAVN